MATFVISPSKQETANFTMDDWANLADEGLEALDSVGLLPKGMKEKVKDIFLNEAQIPAGNDTAIIENISHVAMLLFAGYVDAATSMSVSCGGGGGSVSSGWGKKDDEDDREYARRCLQMAHAICKPRPQRRFHR